MGKVARQCDGGDLFIDGVLGVWYAQAAPDLGLFPTELQHLLAEVGEQILQPCFQPPHLGQVATVAQQLDTAPDFAYGDDAE